MRYFKNLVKPYLIWAVLFVVVPLVMIFIYAFTKTGNPVSNIQFTLDNFAKIGDPIYLSVFLKSFELGLVTSAICLVLGYTFAYSITKFSDKVQSVLILFVTIPMWINMLLRTYAWTSILSENGLINSFLERFGFGSLNLMYTDFAVIVGLVCNFLPFMIIPIHTVVSKMDKSMIEAAYDLGANKFQVFWKVIFKHSIPGVINGVIMVFLLSVSSFVIPKILGGGQYLLIGNLIENQFISVGNWNFGSAISMILALIILLAIHFMRKIDQSEE